MKHIFFGLAKCMIVVNPCVEIYNKCVLEFTAEGTLFLFSYRLLILDNCLFSFVDIRENDWPAILITNPKESMFMQPTKAPLEDDY